MSPDQAVRRIAIKLNITPAEQAMLVAIWNAGEAGCPPRELPAKTEGSRSVVLTKLRGRIKDLPGIAIHSRMAEAPGKHDSKVAGYVLRGADQLTLRAEREPWRTPVSWGLQRQPELLAVELLKNAEHWTTEAELRAVLVRNGSQALTGAMTRTVVAHLRLQLPEGLTIETKDQTREVPRGPGAWRFDAATRDRLAELRVEAGFTVSR